MRLLLVLLLCGFAGGAGAMEVAGVAFAEAVTVGGEDTLLNGAGLRRILLFKAYVIGLYLPHRDGTLEEVLADRGAKRLRIVAMRELEAERISNTIDSGLHRNLSDAEFQAIAGRVELLRRAIHATARARSGAEILLDWVPGGGSGVTRLTVDGVVRGSDIPGEDFYHALLKVWLGQNVNDPPLRDILLGRGGR